MESPIGLLPTDEILSRKCFIEEVEKFLPDILDIVPVIKIQGA